MKKFIEQIIKRYIGKSNYKKHVLYLMSGRVIAQFVPILLTPVLTRIYSPSEFGVFGVYFTIVSLVSMISSGRYCLAVLLPKEEEKAQGIYFLSSIFSIIISFVFFAIMLLWADPIFSFLNAEILTSYTILIFLNVLVLGLSEPAYYYGLRQKKYKILSVNVIVQSLIVVAFRLILGYFVSTEYGLLLAHLLGYSVSFLLLLFRLQIYKFNFLELFSNLKSLAKKYIQFPKYSLFADTLSMGANLSPNLFMNGIFGSIATGYYAMTDKILGSPIWFVTSSVGDVFKQEATEQFREKGSAYTLFIKTTRTLFLLGIVPFALIFIFVPYVIPFLLGDGWESVADFIKIFVVMYFAKFVVNPVSYIVYIVNKQGHNILFQGMRFSSLVIAFIFGYYSGDLYLTLIFWSVLTTISYIITFFIALKISRDAVYVPPK